MENNNPENESTNKTEETVKEVKKEAKGFLGMLFDFSFTHFVTAKIIKVLYAIFIFFAGVMALVFIVNGFLSSVGMGIVFLIVSPLIFLLYVIGARIWLEIVLVMFKIADDVKKIANK